MGSLNASGVPVVVKQPYSFIHKDIDIEFTDNRNDSVSGVVGFNPALHRAIRSGSIVRDNGSVDYAENLVVGAFFMARTSDERIASADTSRVSVVPLTPSGVVVIEESLQPTTPSKGVRHTGNRVVVGNTATHAVDTRASNSGAF